MLSRSYSTAAKSVKVLSRDAPGHLSTLSAVVQNAGSKAGKSGVAHLLSKYNFLNTEVKSALRFTRESELLGGTFSTQVTRDAIILNASFLREDLPYYVEAFGNVLSKTSYRPHELPETVFPVAKAEYEHAHASNKFTAVEALHELSFRRGLGQPLYYDGTSKVTLEDIKQFASEAYTAENVTVVASGTDTKDLTTFVDAFFSDLPKKTSTKVPVEFFEGQETRIRKSGQSVALIGVPVKKADFGKFEILTAAVGTSTLPGATSPISKIPGADSSFLKYQDAGLFFVSVTGNDASTVASGIKAAKKIIDSVSASQLQGSVKAAELNLALQESFEFPHNVKVEESQVKSAYKLGKFNYVAVGNTDLLPYANEL